MRWSDWSSFICGADTSKYKYPVELSVKDQEEQLSALMEYFDIEFHTEPEKVIVRKRKRRGKN